MKLLSAILPIALKLAKKAALSVVVKSVASGKVKLSKKDVLEAIEAIEAEARRQVLKRVG